MKASEKKSACSALIALFLIIVPASQLWSAPSGFRSGGLGAPASSASNAKVEGFRSAKFGMKADQALKAIAKDFRISKSRVKKEVHPTERTTNYLVEVNNLIPDSGKAEIAYIFGFKSKKLFQVNVLWRNDKSPKQNTQGLIATANLLRSLFLKKGFAKDKSIANHQLKDGSIIVFRGQDNLGRMVLLYLNNPLGNPEQAKTKSAKEKAELAKKITLMLSYMENPKQPDIFKLNEDDF